MSSIAAGTTLTTALVSTGDTTGELVLKTNGTTTAVTIDTSQNVAVVGQIVAAAGTVSLPSITTTGDVNTGIFFSAADTLVVTTGGTAAVTVDSGQRTKFPTTIGVGGATPSASGSGISGIYYEEGTFPAAGTITVCILIDANTLGDDYDWIYGELEIRVDFLRESNTSMYMDVQEGDGTNPATDAANHITTGTSIRFILSYITN
jgi:hypothetical protein